LGLLLVGSEYAEPSPESAAKVLEESSLDKELSPDKYTMAYKLDRKTEAEGVYPIVLTSYLIACTKYDSADEAAAVKAYLEYVISPEGQELAAEQAGSAPLSSALTAKVTPAIEAIEAG
jgi:phosphate transport system substrate-binding protein